MSQYLLFGSQASLFTRKAWGFLRWRKLDYDEQDIITEIMEKVILANVGWPVIPILQTSDGEITQDTVDLIAHVETQFPDPSFMLNGPVQRLVSHLIQLYADEWLTIRRCIIVGIVRNGFILNLAVHLRPKHLPKINTGSAIVYALWSGAL
jgi:hypothetical protein